MSTSRFARLPAALLLLGLLGIALATFHDYGITTDEGVQHRYGRRIVRWYASLGAENGATRTNDLYYYGGFFELCAQAAAALLPLDDYDARHLTGALFGWLGFLAAWGIGSRLGGPWAGLASAGFLALTPRFYGEMFANGKDVPFASLFALAAWAALWGSERRPGWPEVLLTGIAIGLASGVRVAGIVLYAATAALWLGCWWLRRGERREGRVAERGPGSVLLALGVVLAIGWTVMVALWPWAQLDPLRHPIRAFLKFSQFWPAASVFYDGRLYLSGDLPWHYLPRLLALTLPEIYAVAVLLGVPAAAARLGAAARGPQGLERAFRTLWVCALAVGPLAWIVFRRTPVYNGIRHVLFVVPLLAVLAGLSAAQLTAWRSRLPRALAACALAVAIAVTLADMVALHPYQYVYFNRLVAGGLPRAGRRYETDYLCASYKEGIEWMAREYLPGRAEKVRVDGHCSHVPFWRYVGREAVETTHARPHLFFAITAFGDDWSVPGRVVHVVERQGTPLLRVLEQREPR